MAERTAGSRTPRGTAASGGRRAAGSGPADRAKAAPSFRRARLPQENREGLIVERAIRFFATAGFQANTRDLARSIGISQPLLYHYFPSKDALIERIFEVLYASRWKPIWETWLRDRGEPLAARLERFYLDYWDTVLTREWTRIFFFTALRDMNMHKRNALIVRERIVHTIIRELRAELGVVPADRPITPAEEEIGWNLHAGVFYLGIRQWILDTPSPLGPHGAVRYEIALFLDGARAAVARAMPVSVSAAPAPEPVSS